MADTQTQTRTPAVYEAVRKDPPAKSSRTALFSVLEGIQAEPGEWFQVVESASKQGANSIKTAINTGKRKVPEGNYSYRASTDDPVEGKSVLYARYEESSDNGETA